MDLWHKKYSLALKINIKITLSSGYSSFTQPSPGNRIFYVPHYILEKKEINKLSAINPCHVMERRAKALYKCKK